MRPKYIEKKLVGRYCTVAEFVSGTTCADDTAQLTVFLKNLVQRFANLDEPTLLDVLNALKGLQKTMRLDEKALFEVFAQFDEFNGGE